MGKIKILSREVADQIAAGEVVERPASIVKELVDNAVDAGATEIEIRLENGGINRIEVLDNGSGMDREDLKLAVVRHGTSKLGQIDDLLAIETLGFRGEALASIGAVSKFMIASMMRGQVGGWELMVDAGKIGVSHEVGMEVGTRIIVEDLFFNVPARRKFLRAGNTEWRYCLEMVEKLSLACPGVGIRLWHNDKLYVDLVGVKSRQARIRSIYGLEDLMFEVAYDHLHWKIWGMVGKPQTGKEKGLRQVVIVNDRVVVDRGVARSIKEALGSLLPPRYQVPWILYFKIPGEMVDINVHPRKEEVRFVNPYGVYSAVVKMIENQLLKENMRYVRGETDERDVIDLGAGVKSWKSEYLQDKEMTSFHSQSRKINFDLERSGVSYSKQTNILMNYEGATLSNKYMQIHNLYIVFEEENGLVLIDQHAAHERIRYEELMEVVKHNVGRSVDVLIPIEIKVLVSEREVLKEHSKILEKIGLKLDFSGDGLRILSVPSGWEDVNIGQAMAEVVGDLMDEGRIDGLSDEQTKVLTYLSCRTAIKGGQRLSQMEMENLVRKLRECKLPFTCPHGRPVEILITWREWEKMFLRVGM